MTRSFLTGTMLMTAAAALLAFAGRAGATEPNPDTYGTHATSYIQVPASAFMPIDSANGYTTSNSGYHDLVIRYGKTAEHQTMFSAPLALPSGALITFFALDYCDTNSNTQGDVQGSLVICGNIIEGCDTPGFVASGGSDGCTSLTRDLSASGLVVDNFTHHYSLVAMTFSNDGSNGIRGMRVGYVLQVSPAPAVASFVDVPTSSPIFRFVEALKASGITAGCDATHYCPNSPLTRGQMAVFLASGLGLQFP